MKNLFLPVLVLLLFTSCDKRIGQCEKTAESFFAAIMEGDEEAMLKAYPLLTIYTISHIRTHIRLTQLKRFQIIVTKLILQIHIQKETILSLKKSLFIWSPSMMIR